MGGAVHESVEPYEIMHPLGNLHSKSIIEANTALCHRPAKYNVQARKTICLHLNTRYYKAYRHVQQSVATSLSDK